MTALHEGKLLEAGKQTALHEGEPRCSIEQAGARLLVANRLTIKVLLYSC